MTPGFLDFPSKIYATIGVLLVAYISQGSKLTVPPSCLPWIKRKKKKLLFTIVGSFPNRICVGQG